MNLASRAQSRVVERPGLQESIFHPNPAFLSLPGLTQTQDGDEFGGHGSSSIGRDTRLNPCVPPNRRGAMAPKLIAVLCLGLCLGQKICTHAGAPDRLSLSARPSPVVPLGGRVTLSCDSHRRFKISGTHYRELHTGRSNNFTISPVTSGHAGIYRCSGSYGRISQWSAPHSNSLMVVVTGAFRKPSISAHPSSLVAAGARVTPALSLGAGI
ncbi:putative killer cell immunoglobulin-like receptor-like protein KIR3DX1 [Plecturocebus cupreus]